MTDHPTPAASTATAVIDSDHPAIVAFAHQHAQGNDTRERAVALYLAVRDGFRYDPYRIDLSPLGMRASTVLASGYGWCVPKAVLLAGACRAAGIPARLGFADVRNHLSTERMPLSLLPPEQRVNTAPRISAANSLLAALALILLGVALALPVWQKQQAIAAINPLVQDAKRQAEGADRLKSELDTLVQTYDFLLQRKHSYPAATAVIDELTRVLPDGTWLQQLNLRSHPKGWEIQLQGETTISSRLASVIEDSPLFRDAGFKSPLIKGQAPASERFHLGAELESASAPKPQRLADKRPAGPSVDAAAAPASRP